MQFPPPRSPLTAAVQSRPVRSGQPLRGAEIERNAMLVLDVKLARLILPRANWLNFGVNVTL